jgi:hypothetical protein
MKAWCSRIAGESHLIHQRGIEPFQPLLDSFVVFGQSGILNKDATDAPRTHPGRGVIRQKAFHAAMTPPGPPHARLQRATNAGVTDDHLASRVAGRELPVTGNGQTRFVISIQHLQETPVRGGMQTGKHRRGNKVAAADKNHKG